MYQMACQKRLGAGAASGGSLASPSTLTAIHRIEQPAGQLQIANVSSRAATEVSATRSTTAAPAPHADPDAPFALRQRAHRQRDHQGVIARQQQIDQDDATARSCRKCMDPPRSSARARPEIALRRTHVFEDLGLQRLRHSRICARRGPAAETPRGCAAAPRPASGSSRNVSIVRLVARAEGRPVPDIGDRVPLAPVVQVARARDVDAARRNHFRRASPGSASARSARAHAAPAHHLAFQRRTACCSSRAASDTRPARDQLADAAAAHHAPAPGHRRHDLGLESEPPPSSASTSTLPACRWPKRKLSPTSTARAPSRSTSNCSHELLRRQHAPARA